MDDDEDSNEDEEGKGTQGGRTFVVTQRGRDLEDDSEEEEEESTDDDDEIDKVIKWVGGSAADWVWQPINACDGEVPLYTCTYL